MKKDISTGEDEKHYKSLIDLFKFSLGLVTTLVTLIGFAVGFITYKGGQEMRGAFEKERDRLSAQMADMRKDVKEEKERLKSDLNEAKNDLALKERELTESANILTTSVKRDISTTRFNALSQIRLGFNIEVQFTGF